jgi:hypothetical protein
MGWYGWKNPQFYADFKNTNLSYDQNAPKTVLSKKLFSEKIPNIQGLWLYLFLWAFCKGKLDHFEISVELRILFVLISIHLKNKNFWTLVGKTWKYKESPLLLWSIKVHLLVGENPKKIQKKSKNRLLLVNIQVQVIFHAIGRKNKQVANKNFGS